MARPNYGGNSWFFHGTSLKSWEKIQSEGIRPSSNSRPVFLTKDIWLALSNASTHFPDPSVILAVNISNLESDRMVGSAHELTYSGIVHPADILLLHEVSLSDVKLSYLSYWSSQWEVHPDEWLSELDKMERND